MPEPDQKDDKYYIVAASSVLDPFKLIQKAGDLFGVYDRFGDIMPTGKREQGLYFEGTRFLSLYEFKINGIRPLFLSSNIDRDNILLTADLTNPDIYSDGKKISLKRDSVHIMRSRLLLDNRCQEYVRIKNFGEEAAAFQIELSLDADFRDIFEVRGISRKKRGALLSPEANGSQIRLAYEGLDGIKRATLVKFSKPPDGAKDKTYFFNIVLPPNGMESLYFTIDCQVNGQVAEDISFDNAIVKARKRFDKKARSTVEIYSSNAQFNESINRATSDLNMMITETDYGSYPYGGIPWFCTPFGRDAIITALECMWFEPAFAKGVLTYLASRQAHEFDPGKASEPGKIMHEARSGEMANLNEIPFGLYYGSVDSTPLFIILAGAYWRRTGDIQLIRKIWDNILEAINWMDEYGDVDGDGFLEYVPDVKGLRNQGWKDSQDSVFYKNGNLAEGAIALSEVQGYLYAAKKEASSLARLLGKNELSQKLFREAEQVKRRFNEVFWNEGLGAYVLALDSSKRPCEVVTSNAGHALFTGIADPDKAVKVANTLTSEAAFSGWGIRTVAAKEARYNPMSYHNGSVWPHDNALIAYGMASYGLKEQFEKVFTGIFEASLFMEFQRLPELFCGFHRREGVAPTLYPVACSPQTWASGALIYMLQASLGMHFEAKKSIVVFKESTLPEFLNYVYLNNLMITPKKSVDLLITRYGNDVTIEALRKPQDVNILIIK